MNRRSFVKNMCFAITAVLVSPRFAFSDNSNGSKNSTSLPKLKETDPKAVELGFHLDATKVDTKKWEKRAGPGGATKFCHGCQFFTTVDSNYGSCQTYKALVPKNGWCNAWIKKTT